MDGRVESRVDGGEAAVDDQRGAGDPRRVAGGEEGDGCRDVLGFTDPAEGIQPLHLGELGLAPLPGGGADRARDDHVDPYPAARRVPGEGTGQGAEARLACAVGVVAEVLKAVDGADVDDRTAPGGDQVRQRGARAAVGTA